jgi:hypothetical protein
MDDFDQLLNELHIDEKPPRVAGLRCVYDGHEFEGEIFTFPIAHLGGSSYRLSRLPFCSLSCTKAYVRKDNRDPKYLVNFIHYVISKYGISNVRTALPINQLACYDVEGVGMTLEAWRAFDGKSPTLKREGHSHSTDPNVFECIAQTTHVPLVVDRRELKQEEYSAAVVRANAKKRSKVTKIVTAVSTLLKQPEKKQEEVQEEEEEHEEEEEEVEEVLVGQSMPPPPPRPPPLKAKRNNQSTAEILQAPENQKIDVEAELAMNAVMESMFPETDDEEQVEIDSSDEEEY